MNDSWALIQVVISLDTACSWSLSIFSGPVANQFRVSSMVWENSAASSGPPATDCWTTKASTPSTTSTARTTAATAAVARPSPLPVAQATSGWSRAANSRARVTGTVTSSDLMNSQPTVTTATPISSSRQDQAAATRTPGETRSAAMKGRDGSGAGSVGAVSFVTPRP